MPEIKFSNQPPPRKIYDKSVEMFEADFDRGTTYTIGDTIHCKGKVSPDLFEHEKIHVMQQEKIGKDKWWDKYFADEEFRLEQELEAYRAQYKWVFKNVRDRNQKSKYLVFFAQCLSGKMYGNLLSMQEAINKIKKFN